MAKLRNPNKITMDQSAPKGILDQTLGELLSAHPDAQQKVMSSMNITPEKLQEMLSLTKENPMMQMKIGDLFKNGIVGQAVVQNQQITTVLPAQNMQKPSLLEKIRLWFVR